MPHWKTLFEYKHLGCWDLPQNEDKTYQDIVVTIKSIAKEVVKGEGGKEDNCPVAQLVGAKKPMILNKTNLANLAELFGTTEWPEYVGKTVTLYAAKVKGKAGGIVDGLRIRTTLPNIVDNRPEMSPEHPKWQGAKDALKAGNTTIEAIKGTYQLTAENEAKLKANG